MLGFSPLASAPLADDGVEAGVSVSVSVTGLSATGQVGSVVVDTAGNVSVAVTGLSAAGQVGSVSLNTDQVLSVTGLSATGNVGSVVVGTAGNVSVAVTGLSAAGQVGSVSLNTDQVLSVTGLSATGNVGSVVVGTAGNVSVIVTGLSATGQVGSAAVSGAANVGVVAQNLFDTSGQTALPSDVFFKPDGTKMYVADRNNVAVYEYDLATAWDVRTSVYNQSLSLAPDGVAVPQGLFFRSDGTKLYLISSSETVHEYDLSTAWDISSASYVQTLTVTEPTSSTLGLFFKPDGTKLYLGARTGGLVYEYDLSTAWDISTASYLQVSTDTITAGGLSGLFFKPDGTRLYVSANFPSGVFEHELSTPWDISTVSLVASVSTTAQTDAMADLFIKSDGSRLYLISGTLDTVFQYDLSTPWSVATVSYGPSALGQTGTSAAQTDQVLAVTGLSATGQVGTAAAINVTTVPVTGVAATGQVGTPTIQTDQVLAVTGVAATGQVNSVAVTADANVPETGLSATGNVGTVLVSANANVAPTGLSATGQVGEVTVPENASVSVTGVAATGQVGTAVVSLRATVLVTGVSATGAVGTVQAAAGASVTLTGVSAIGRVGQVIVWGPIIPAPGNEWTNLDPDATNVWTDIAPDAGAVWIPVAA